MPSRKIPLINGQYYHVFNRGVNKQLIFEDKRDYSRASRVLEFYQYNNLPFRYSKFKQLSEADEAKIWKELRLKHTKMVEVVAYCFMPNHFHLLIHQLTDSGISRFLSDFQNSYCRYFNTRYRRIGPLFQGQFKAVRLEDDSQLLHVSRYIHLNPFTGYLVGKIDDLLHYLWSSFPEYLDGGNFCSKDIVLGQFKDRRDYKEFVYNQSDYQRTLDTIRHLSLD